MKRYYAITQTTVCINKEYIKGIQFKLDIVKNKEYDKKFRDYVYEELVESVRDGLRQRIENARKRNDPDIVLEEVVENYITLSKKIDEDGNLGVLFFDKKKEMKGVIPIQRDNETNKLYIEL